MTSKNRERWNPHVSSSVSVSPWPHPRTPSPCPTRIVPSLSLKSFACFEPAYMNIQLGFLHHLSHLSATIQTTKSAQTRLMHLRLSLYSSSLMSPALKAVCVFDIRGKCAFISRSVFPTPTDAFVDFFSHKGQTVITF